jgi:tetratricopeptide (TPR) repeat protein
MRGLALLTVLPAFLLCLSGPAGAQEPPDPRAEIGALFAELKRATAAKDGPGITDLFDFDEMLVEMKKWGSSPDLTAEQEEMLLLGIRLGFGAQMVNQGDFGTWERLTVQQVDPSEDGDRTAVLTREVDSQGVVTKSRWWLKRGENGWRIYDQQDRGIGIRMSLVMASALAAVQKGNVTWIFSIQTICEAGAAIYDEDFEEAERLLSSIRGIEFPPRINALCHLLESFVDVWFDRSEQALKHLEVVERDAPEVVMRHLSKASALFALGRNEEALAEAGKFRAIYGEDPAGRLVEGYALAALDRVEEALAAFRKGLDDAPEDLDCLLGLVEHLPEDRVGEVGERFRRYREPVESFWDLFETLVDLEHEAAAVAVLAVFRTIAPEHTDADLAEGWLNVHRENYEEAAAAYRRALPRVKDPEERQHLRNCYLDAMARAGHAVAAYAEVPGSSAAFRLLADVVGEASAGETLLELVAAHEGELPDDLWLSFYRGRGLELTGDRAGAESSYAEGMGRASDDETRETFRRARVANLHADGKGLLAYEKVGPRRVTFRELAQLFSWDEDAESLAALTDAHAEADPKDPAVRLYRGEVLWLMGNLEGMVGLLEGLSDTLAKEEDLLLQYEDRLVRGLARLGRVKEALELATASTERDADPYFEAVVYAITRDARATGRILDLLAAEGYEAADFWIDEDIGEALGTEAFKALRERYPRPE